MTDKFEEHKKHIEEIKDDVTDLIENRFVFYKLRELLQPNIEITNNIFFDHYVVNYASTMSSGVRRQIDKKTTRGGLKKLLENLIADPASVAKDDYLGHYSKLASPSFMVHIGNKSWSEKYGGGEIISVSILEADLAELEGLTDKVKNFVDKRIAHKDKEWETYQITYKDLDDAVNILEKLVIKYYELFTGGGFSALMPSIQYPWEDVFKKPWVG